MNTLRLAGRWSAVLFFWLCLLITNTWAAPSFPALTGRVVDNAHLLSAPQQAALTQALTNLESQTTQQLVVVTLPSLQGYDIADYGYQLGRAWGIGQKGKNNGLLLILAPTEHKVRIEVGYGLEGTVTDALASVIIQQAIIPRIKANDLPGGLIAGVNALAGVLTGQDLAYWQQQTARSAADEPSSPGMVGLIVLLFFIMVFVMGRVGSPLWLLGGLMSGGSSFGGGFGDSNNGGGFSGGGGSFGGGGASGDW